jgi:phosphoribosyl 1,2-cyclic phosphodiesterase
MDKLRFLSLGSGSSGNCYFFGNAFQGILIDAGISARTVRKSLVEIGLDMTKILGVFISHDHVDHIKAVGSLSDRYNLPVYATKKTHEGISRNWNAPSVLNGNKRILEAGQTKEIGDFSITPYNVSHDASESVCFHLTYKSHKILIATDLGYANEEIIRLVKCCDIVILEANYDIEMLEKGSYPYYLKQRIVSETGHLSNNEAAKTLAENWHENLKHIFLCHLSKDNNRPDIALDTVISSLQEKGIDYGETVRIHPLKRYMDELIIF